MSTTLRRLANAAIAVLACTVISAAVWVVRDTTTRAGGSASTAAPAAAAPARRSPSATRSAGAKAAATAHVVAFLGDEWTLGPQGSSASLRFSSRVANALALTERNFGMARSGYAARSRERLDFVQRIDAVVSSHPDVIVVTGGRYDVLRHEVAPAERNATTLFATLHARLPRATLVAVEPFWGDSAAPTRLRELGRAVRAAVTRVGGTFIALPDPLRGHPEDMASAADPNARGHAAIAGDLTPELRAAVSP